MSDRTVIPFKPWTRSEAADAAFAIDVEAIKADCRARRARDRETFWARATAPISDVQADYDDARADRDWFLPEEASHVG